MNRKEVLERVRAELELADRARAEHNEGRARVCARRAAGWAAGFYLQSRAGMSENLDALKSLKTFRDLSDAGDRLRGAADRLIARVTADHRLPHDEDPLEDARLLVRALLERPSGSRP